MKKIKMGILGVGQFSRQFIPLWKAHPAVSEVVLCDLIPERVAQTCGQFDISQSAPDFDTLLKSDVDAIAIYTQRHLHAPQALRCLGAGKHVYCAVPAAASLDELADLTQAVSKSGLVYMTGETSYYYPTTLYCRKKWEEGAFGRFVYGEGEYYHDMSHGFYEAYQHSGGEQWKRVAGFPPMLYATHSTSMILSITGARVTNVSCLGVKDHHEDGIFRKGANDWDNEFSNQSALMATDDGGALRVNEFRRVGGPHGRSVRLSFFGTEGVFEEQLNTAAFTDRSGKVMEDLSDAMFCRPQIGGVNIEIPESMRRELHQGMNGYTRFHDIGRLPESFRGLHNGHCGSHQFLVDDFLKGIGGASVAHLDIRAAARFCAPGLVAHQSALQGGERLAVPVY